METTKSLIGTVFGTLEYNGWTIEYEATVTGSKSYSPGRMYIPNGDSGHPDEYDCEGPYLDNIIYINIDDVEHPDLILEQNRERIEQAIKEEIEEEFDWDDITWLEEEDWPEPDGPNSDDYDNWDFEE